MATTHWWLGTTSTDPMVAANWSTTGSGGAPGITIPGYGDTARLDSGSSASMTLTSHWGLGNLDVDAGYTYNINLGGYDLTMGIGGNIFVSHSGFFRCNTGTITLNNGNLDYNQVGSWIDDTSMVSMSGIGYLNGKIGNSESLYDLQVEAGSTITIANDTEIGHLLTVDGTLDTAGFEVRCSADVEVNTGGYVTGSGSLKLSAPGSGEGLLTMDGTIDCDVLDILQPSRGARLAEATYDSAVVQFRCFGSGSYILELDGTYVFEGDFRLYNSSALGTLYMDNTLYDPDITIEGTFSIESPSTGTIVVDNFPSSATWKIRGDIYDGANANLVWNSNNETLLFDGVSDQHIDMPGITINQVEINKATGYITFESGDYTFGNHSTAAEFNVTGDADVSLGGYDLTLTGGDCNLDTTGTFDWSSGTITVEDGYYDSYNIGTLTTTSDSTLVMDGVGVLLGSSDSQAIRDLQIASGATTTVNHAGSAIYMDGDLIVDGDVIINSTKVLSLPSGGDAHINSGASATGLGTLEFRDVTSGHGLLTHDGTISCNVSFTEPVAGAILRGGTYGGNVKIRSDAAGSHVWTPDTFGNPYVFQSELEFDITAGSLEFKNDVANQTITLQGDLIQTGTGVTTWTKSATAQLKLTGTANQDIATNTHTVEDLVIDKTGGGDVDITNSDIVFDEINMVGTLSTWAGGSDANSGKSFVVGSVVASNFLFDMGDNTTWNVSSFDNSGAGTFDRGTSHVIMTGTGILKSGSSNYYHDVTIATGAEITQGSTTLYTQNSLTVNGHFIIPSGRTLRPRTTCQAHVNMGGRISGDGKFNVYWPTTGGGLLTQNGTIDVTTCTITAMKSDSIIAAGIYASSVFQVQSSNPSSDRIWHPSSGTYDIRGDFELEWNGATGAFGIDNSTNNPDFIFYGDVTFDEDAGLLTYLPGTGTMMLKGTADQAIDFDSITTQNLYFNKSAGNVTLDNIDLNITHSPSLGGNLTVNSGNFDTVTGATINVGGDATLSNNQADMGDSTIWNICGTYDHSGVTTYIPGTAVINSLCAFLLNATSTLFVNGANVDTDIISLYMRGGYGLTFTEDTTLFTHGHQEVNSYTSLRITGMEPVEALIPLFIEGIGVTNHVGLLYIVGTDTRVNSYIPLSVKVDNGTYNDAATLYLLNTQTELVAERGRTLFIEGSLWPSNNSIPLHVINVGSEASASLFIKAAGGTAGYVPTGDGATLFINRPDHSIAIPLFCKAVDNPVNAYTPLHILSFLEDTGSAPLVIPNVTSIAVNSYASLMIQGVEIPDALAPLFGQGHGLLNAAAPLFIKQETGLLNIYSSLYTRGVEGVLPADIPLVISDVVDLSQSPTPLYVFGWGP